MTKRIGGFVEKLFYTIIAYTHGNISPKKFLCQCAHIPCNLIVSIGREYTADPVEEQVKCVSENDDRQKLGYFNPMKNFGFMLLT